MVLHPPLHPHRRPPRAQPPGAVFGVTGVMVSSRGRRGISRGLWSAGYNKGLRLMLRRRSDAKSSHVDTPHTNAQHRAPNFEAHELRGLAALFRIHGFGTDQVDGRSVLAQGRLRHVLRRPGTVAPLRGGSPHDGGSRKRSVHRSGRDQLRTAFPRARDRVACFPRVRRPCLCVRGRFSPARLGKKRQALAHIGQLYRPKQPALPQACGTSRRNA